MPKYSRCFFSADTPAAAQHDTAKREDLPRAGGVDLVRDRETKEPVRAETVRVLDGMRDKGVLIGDGGEYGNVLKIRPPLVFQREHADILVAALAEVLGDLEIDS